MAGLLTASALSAVARVLDDMLPAAFPFVVSEPLLAEYRAVLIRPALRKRHGLAVAGIDTPDTRRRRRVCLGPSPA